MAKFVIFHCYGGAHSSVTSAGIYLGILPRDRVPNDKEFMMVPHYDGDTAITYGHFRYMGRDQTCRTVLVLGKHMMGPLINRLLVVITGIYGCAGNIYSIDTTAFVNVLMIIGGYTSRALNIVRLGRPIVMLGTKLSYYKFVELASRTAEYLNENGGDQDAPLPAERRKIVFYLCPEGFRLPLLVAGWHVRPASSDESMLHWIRNQPFTGAIGSVFYAGAADDYLIYVVGTGREPGMVGRMLRELRSIMDVPQSDCLVQDPAIRSSKINYLATRGCRYFGLDKLFLLWEERLFRTTMDTCRQSSRDVINRIKEGILD